MSKDSISLKDLESYVSKLLNATQFDEKSYNGIQVANQGVVSKIATAVSASEETIRKAIELNVQALIVHHGLFRKTDPHPLVGPLYTKVKLLMDHNIALLGYHLPLDADQTVGNNWKAAKDLGVKECKPFLPYKTIPIGVVGEISATSFESLKQRVQEYYGRKADAVKVKDTIKTVAIVSGAADTCIKDAAQIGADCFITGRVDEPVWDHAHEFGISFLGLGHYATETVGPKALADALHKHFKISVNFIKTDNPF